MDGLHHFNKAAGAGSFEFFEIGRNAPQSLVSQLVAKDAVHRRGADTEENLREYRLGGAGLNRACYAVKDDAGLQSVIYVHRDTKRIMTPRDLCGDVNQILNTPAQEMDAPALSTIFYSITRIGRQKGAGEALVQNLHAHLSGQAPESVMSTLSPLRGFDEYCAEVGLGSMYSHLPHANRKAIAVDYLLAGRDPVQRFHMGNGARIGDVKLDADSVGEQRVMVNYVYPADKEVLAENALRFGQGAINGLVDANLLEEIQARDVMSVQPVPALASPR